MRRPRSIRPRVLLAAAVSALATGLSAQQQQPSEHDLRSMYCLEVIRGEIGLQRHLISASDDAAGSAATSSLRQQWIDTSAELLQGLARLEDTLYRLQVYLLPRIRALDSLALAAAIRQANTDLEDGAAIRSAVCENPAWLTPTGS